MTPDELKTEHPSAETLLRLLGADVCRELGVGPLPEGFLLSVVVPAYNEAETIEEILRRVKDSPVPKEILVVDDGSTDGTRERLREIEEEWADAAGNRLRLFFHEKNQGKGAALRTGFAAATGDVVLVQDADLEYDPVHYPQLVRPIVEGAADVVYGSRFISSQPHRVLYFWHSVANRMLTTASNMLTDLNLTDMETCYKAFRREVIEAIGPTLKENGFGVEPEMTAKVARRKYRIYELGVSYYGRTYAEGKKIGLRDAIRAIWCIVRYWKWD